MREYKLLIDGEQAYSLTATPFDFPLPAGFLPAAKVDVKADYRHSLHGLGNVLIEQAAKRYTVLVEWSELFGELGQFWWDRLSAGAERVYLGLYAFDGVKLTELNSYREFSELAYSENGKNAVFLLKAK